MAEHAKANDRDRLECRQVEREGLGGKSCGGAGRWDCVLEAVHGDHHRGVEDGAYS